MWGLLQIVVNLGLGLSCWVLWMRSKKAPQEDQRMSRGLQLLTSKIAILEDLSDRTDRQVQQLTELLEQRSRTLQTKIFEGEKLVRELDQSMRKSREVAEIFQDRIPHEEIIERQNTIRYVKAAQMAHRGSTIEEIAAQVDLPREQLEFIAKVNRKQLMFDTAQLPEWAKPHLESSPKAGASLDFVESAADPAPAATPAPRPTVAEQAMMNTATDILNQQLQAQKTAASPSASAQPQNAAVRTVKFPRIDTL